jgi:vibriolysin
MNCRSIFCLRLRTRLASSLFAALLLVPQLLAAQPEILGRDAQGVPNFVRGDLGSVGSIATDPSARTPEAESYRESVRVFALQFALDYLGAEGNEELRPARFTRDALGQTHSRFHQYIGGLRVYGADLAVHADAVTGEVTVVNGSFVSGAGLSLTPALRSTRALGIAISDLGVADFGLRGVPELCFVIEPNSGDARLAWRQLIDFQVDGQDQADYLYADAASGGLVTKHPTIHPVKSWRTYDGNNGSSLPGSLDCTNTQACSDSVLQAAHDNASLTYDYYADKFGRDSLDDNGMTLLSTAHHRLNYNNAFWNGQQMAYGDGDGTTFAPFPLSLDVVAHELTHGVTDFESDLIYANESGALNEALSDIFGAAAEAFRDGAISSDTWKVGEDVYTPNQAGDALRYMDDPTDDGSSYDYYPERYTGSQDNGGVHWNSGIANLAFYLMVEGGTHPRGKTTVTVPAIGMSKAEQIFYRAQTSYLTASSTFQAARNATTQAAADLYGDTEVAAVHAAWCSVGVPGCPGTDPGPGGATELDNGVPETGLSGARGSVLEFFIDVPDNATGLQFQISGGSGDADLYVRFGSAPTTSNYDCRPYKSGNNETCSFNSPNEGTYFVSLVGYSSFSGVTLLASFDEDGGPGPGTGVLTNGVPKTGLSGASGSTQFFTLEVPAGATNLKFQLSGGSGDGDLYVRRGSAPTTSTYDCRPYKSGNNETCDFAAPQAGTWHVMLRGYTSFSGATLLATFSTGGGGCTPESGTLTGLSGSRGAENFYYIDVPACATKVTVKLSGGSGDADLYVRFGTAPTTGNYDCRPYLIGNNETCTAQPAQEGRYHIMIRAYSSYSGATLTAGFE